MIAIISDMMFIAIEGRAKAHEPPHRETGQVWYHDASHGKPNKEPSEAAVHGKPYEESSYGGPKRCAIEKPIHWRSNRITSARSQLRHQVRILLHHLIYLADLTAE